MVSIYVCCTCKHLQVWEGVHGGRDNGPTAVNMVSWSVDVQNTP